MSLRGTWQLRGCFRHENTPSSILEDVFDVVFIFRSKIEKDAYICRKKGTELHH
jgi:hypothetical protein